MLCFLALFLSADAPAQSLSDLAVKPAAIQPGDTLILGFLGAWERWDDEHRNVRRLALKLRSEGLPGTHVETLSNHKRKVALNLIRKALDRDQDGRIGPQESSGMRIILYGQSLGGLAVVKLARALHNDGIPVLLTIQIDSVGLTDSTVPENVAAAANLYQQGWFSFRGQRTIHASDPTRTRILENRRYDYPLISPERRAETWARRRLGGGHAEMEADPAVWAHVEQLIRGSLKGLQ